jgi:hypothetical protein
MVIWHIQCLSMESSHRYNITVTLTKILQFQHISCDYSNPWQQEEFQHEESRLQRKTIITSKTNIDQYKLSQPRYYTSNCLFYHSLAHCLAHRLSIARYCFKFAPLLHSCITYRFFICDAPYKILKRATHVILSSFSLLLSL